MATHEPTATPEDIFALAAANGWRVVLRAGTGYHEGTALINGGPKGNRPRLFYKLRDDRGRVLVFQPEEVDAIRLAT